MRICFVMMCMFFTGVIDAQTEVKATPGVSRNSSFLAFETNLAQGELVFTKSIVSNGSGGAILSYSIKQKKYNNGKPVAVQLNRESFDTYFKRTQALFAAYPQIIRYAQDKNISFTDEGGWAELIRNYNNSVAP